MEHRRFGRNDLDVPVIGMGTWKTYDVRGPEARARQAVTDAALAAGVTFFDSSPMYGDAERVLGATLQGRRDAAIVATKVWSDDPAEADAQVTTSLGHFGGRVDVYQVHNLLDVDRRLAQLDGLRAQRKAGVIGLTHYSPSKFGDLRRLMEDPRVGAIQVPYNPAERDVEAEILPAAVDLGLGVIVMRPLGQGRLAARDVTLETIAPLRPFGVTSWAQALLKWILSDPRCHVVIPATSRVDHVQLNAAAGSPPWFGAEERAYVAKVALGV
jgi:aryl-alcohol dehydrogenase-like predicted oxidoreductase